MISRYLEFSIQIYFWQVWQWCICFASSTGRYSSVIILIICYTVEYEMLFGVLFSHRIRAWISLLQNKYTMQVCLLAAGTRIRRLICHPTEQSCVMSAVHGNNEVSVWNLETHCRQTVLWASSAPPLTHTTVSFIMFAPNFL